MERIIPLSSLRKAVDEAYEKYKSLKEGAVDPCIQAPAHDEFGIAVVLADGTVIAKADDSVLAPIGRIGRYGVASLLLTTNSAQELLKKSGMCCCCKAGANGDKTAKPAVSHKIASPKVVRAISAIEPQGDADSKWNFIENMLTSLMGSAPKISLKLYECIKQAQAKEDAVNAFGQSGFYLYDDAALSLDIYARLASMQASARQLAIMGATIAADGVNPITKQVVFDGANSQRLVAMMAARGMGKHRSMPWLVASGLPASFSFAGSIVGVMPGVMGIAAYSPEVNEKGISVKASKAIIDIMNSLGISALGSASVRFDPDK